MTVLSPDWKPLPFWWEDAPLEQAPAPVPSRCDVAIIGSGYCGLSAARILASHGARVVVLDAEDPGFGGSSRNSGHVSVTPRIPDDLESLVGGERARTIREECREANAFFHALVKTIDADYVQCGRFIGAHSQDAYSMLQRRAELYRRHYGVTVREIPEREQKAEIGSDFYRGGIVVEEAGSVHPAKLYRGIRRLAEEAGVTICGRARVDRIDRSGLRFRLSTARGSLDADQLIVATNGYAGSVLPFLQRRVIPITPYMTATEPLPADLARAILPTNRNGGDTKRLIYAFRRSPKGDRLIFTGRARGNHVDERAASDVLHRFLSGVWPDLARFRLTHSWKGFIGFTFDLLPHMGDHNGVHYAAGCQGAGVILMTWLGHRLGTKLLGIDSRQSGFDSADFQGSAFYHGTPWFLPALEARYRVQDWFERRT